MRDWAIDRGWPHQVALHSDLLLDDQFRPIHDFAHQLALAPRNRIVYKIEATGYQQQYTIFCFADRRSAEAFQARFGGYFFDPTADRGTPKGRNVWTWREWGNAADRYPEIIARLERVRSWEPSLDADIAWLLGIKPIVRFTRERGEVECFLAGRLVQGEWEVWNDPHIDAKVRQGPDEAWRHACENRTRPRDCEATALTLAYLRGCAFAFASPNAP